MSRPSVDSGQILDQPQAATDGQAEPTTNAEVVFKGRNVEIPDHYRVYVSQKLARLERFDRSIRELNASGGSVLGTAALQEGRRTSYCCVGTCCWNAREPWVRNS